MKLHNVPLNTWVEIADRNSPFFTQDVLVKYEEGINMVCQDKYGTFKRVNKQTKVHVLNVQERAAAVWPMPVTGISKPDPVDDVVDTILTAVTIAEVSTFIEDEIVSTTSSSSTSDFTSGGGDSGGGGASVDY